MSYVIRISDKLAREAKLACSAEGCSPSDQIEHWAKIGKRVEENPKLTYAIIKGVLCELDDGRPMD